MELMTSKNVVTSFLIPKSNSIISGLAAAGLFEVTDTKTSDHLSLFPRSRKAYPSPPHPMPKTPANSGSWLILDWGKIIKL